MTGSVALDVAISLVFIYLLYSLFITIIGEMISAWIGLRVRILRLAIERILNDGHNYESQNAIGNFFLYQYKGFEGIFYNISSTFL